MTSFSLGYNSPMSKKVSATRAQQQVVRDEKAQVKRTTDAKRASEAKGRAAIGDSFANFTAKIGIGTGNISSGAGYGFNPITRERTLLEWIHRGSWIAGMAIDIIPDDMTRAGVTLKGKLKPDQIEEISETAVSLDIWSKLRDNAAWGRLYGGSIAVMMVAGQDYESPLRIETIGKGQFKGLIVLDRWMVQASVEDLVTEEGPYMGLPKFYFVTANAPGLRGFKIHYSRCIRMEGPKLPWWQQLTENLWSESVLERLYDRLVAFDSATQGAAQLVYKAYIRTYGIKDLREIVSAGGQALDGLVKQVEMMRLFQSIEGITLIDAEDEFVENTGGSSAGQGIAEILVHFGEQISGALQIPLVRLFGQSPAGLNSTGDSDLQTYYENIANWQNKQLKVGVTLVYRAIMMSLGIKPPKGFGITFNSLKQMTNAEKSEHAAKTMETAQKGIDSGILSQKTAMQEVRQGSSVNDFGTNITDEEINNAEEELPPTAVQVALIKAEATESKEGDETGGGKKPAAKGKGKDCAACQSGDCEAHR